MEKFELVIAGGGLTAARTIKSYRESDGRGQIALLSEESDLPYPLEALLNDLLAEQAPIGTLERELVAGRSL
jgi:hypothetical protein